MLILTRNQDELIYITHKETGHTTTIKILDISRGQRKDRVKIGLHDPDKNYTFLRHEVAIRDRIEIPGVELVFPENYEDVKLSKELEELFQEKGEAA